MTVTRTFGQEITPTYTALAIIEVVHFRDMTFDADERVSCYLDTANAIIDIGSFNIGKFVDLTGDETEVEEALKLNKAENDSDKIGLKILTRKNNTGDWLVIAEFILINYGRTNYLDMRGRLGYPTKLLEKTDAIAIQLVDYGDGLLWDTDFIKVDFGVAIEIVKKNDTAALEARLAALELAVQDRLINLPGGTLLGRNATTGTVQQIPQSQFATPAMIEQAIVDWVGSAPQNLNTLIEFSNAINNDANFASTTINALAAKAPLTSPVFSGFTTLGDNVAIKIKKIQGTTAALASATVSIPHGIIGKIEAVIVKVSYTVNTGIGSDLDNVSGYGLDYSYDLTNIHIQNSSSGNQVLSKPFSVLIFYSSN